MLLVLGVAAWALAAPLPQVSDVGVIRGEVRSERSGEPVAFAVVEVEGSLVPLRAVADSVGAFLLRGVPAGRRLVRARALGHSPLEVEVLVPPGREVRVDFSLRLQPVHLTGITVNANAAVERSGEGGAATDPGELGRAVVRSLEATPGVAELGLLELSRMVGAGQEPVDPTDVLYVRGAPADLKRVLLDGAPVYAPFQAGGLLQAFEPELVRRADLHLGGAPARYDGGLSYLLDLETRAGDRNGFGTSGQADLLTALVVAEGPVGPRAGFMVGARSVHGAGASLLMNDRFPSGYTDLLGRADLEIGGRGHLRATGFWNRESIRLGHDRSATAEEAVWGNRAGSLRYRGVLLGREVEATLATGLYDARLPLGNTEQRVMVDGSAHQTRVTVDFGEGSDRLRINYGGSYEETVLTQRARTTARGTEYVEAVSSGESGGVYVDLDWGAAMRLRVRGGMRADLLSAESSLLLAPRLAVVWAFSERAVLTLAGGRYRQLVRGGTELRLDSLGAIIGHRSSPLRVAEASHLLLGLDQLLAEGVRFGIEGYYKRFDDIPTEIGLSHANASGVDLWLRGGNSRVTGWGGYSLAWVWTGSTTGTTTGTTTDLFSGRQLLSLGVTADIGGGGRVGLRMGYGAGVPYTAVPNGVSLGETLSGQWSRQATVLDSARELVLEAPPISAAPDAPNSPYLRLDAEISYPLQTRWGGAPLTITPYLKIYNALDRRDALFYRSESADPGRPRPVATLPVLPVLGVEWRF